MAGTAIMDIFAKITGQPTPAEIYEESKNPKPEGDPAQGGPGAPTGDGSAPPPVDPSSGP